MRGRAERGASSLVSTARVLALGLLVLATVAVCYLALTRDSDPPKTPESVQEEEASASASASASADPNAIPEVADLVRQDFATSAQLPAGARTAQTATAGSPLVVQDGLLTHAAPTGPKAVSSLELMLPGAVQKIGGVVSFPKGNAGSAFLVGWSTSLVDAGAGATPPSGLRLEVDYGDWSLSIFDKTEMVISGDEYEPAPGALQKFEVYRSEDRAWVVDPAGKVTTVQVPAIEKLTGPWACWQVAEDAKNEKPVGFKEIWAG